MKKSCLFFFLLLIYPLCYSQETPEKGDTLRKDALNVFMNADNYFKNEVPYLNYVRDIKVADVYIISTLQNTGSGGEEYTYFIVGQNDYEGMRDTLSFSVPPDETYESTREKEVKILKLGLMRYVARTPLSRYIDISFTEPMSQTVSSDKWDSWVFRTSLSGYLSGQQSYNYNYLYGSFRVSRVTEDFKTSLTFSYNINNDRYDIGDSIISSYNRSKYINGLAAKSINDHWSYGGSFYIGASSYSNLDFSMNIMPGIEYDLFPYSESTRRQMRFTYKAGFYGANYTDTTIYNKLAENRLLHSLTVAYEVIQKWGSIEVTLAYSNYFHDWTKNNLSLDSYLSLRVAKGLSVYMSGGAELVHDQLGLVKGGASTEEILLQRKELATQYRFYSSFGLSYTFGSIYNNVVNPRFGN